MPEVKDKMTGKTVAKMPYDTAGQMAAEKMVAENPGYEIKDGSMRSEQMYAGGGETGYNAVGNSMYPGGGRVQSKPLKKTATKGGVYNTYRKDSVKAKSFRKAFADAKGKDFVWEGKKYSGEKSK